MFNIFSKKQEPCKECKKVLIGQKYSISRIKEGLERSIRICMALNQTEYYTLEYLAARCSYDQVLMKDFLTVLENIGILDCNDTGEYRVKSIRVQ